MTTLRSWRDVIPGLEVFCAIVVAVSAPLVPGINAQAKEGVSSRPIQEAYYRRLIKDPAKRPYWRSQIASFGLVGVDVGVWCMCKAALTINFRSHVFPAPNVWVNELSRIVRGQQ